MPDPADDMDAHVEDALELEVRTVVIMEEIMVVADIAVSSTAAVEGS